jgi:hypothetical protein
MSKWWKVPVVYRGLSNYMVEAETAEDARLKASEAFRNGDGEAFLGDEWQEIDTIREPAIVSGDPL